MTPEERSHAAEVVCGWMREKPTSDIGDHVPFWIRSLRLGDNDGDPYRFDGYEPCTLDLDALHLVEARLSYEQRGRYQRILLACSAAWTGNETDAEWCYIHADADTKLLALARLLRRHDETRREAEDWTLQ